MVKVLAHRVKNWGIWRRMPELPVVLALLAVVGGVWLFAEVADEVVEDETLAFDHSVLQAMRSPDNPHDPWGPRWLEIAAVDVTTLGNATTIAIIVVAVVTYLALTSRWHKALLVLVTVSTGLGLTCLIKSFIDRGRPDVVPHLVNVSSQSFPSGHAMMSAVVYLTLGTLIAQSSDRRRVKLYVMSLAVVMTLAIGFTRVYLGVHFPTDVLAGWSLGLAWAAVAWLVAWAIRRWA
ncbi:MAG: phosphatase PAP2 family protein [Planctomycetes bacterium]|jgi:undecaprenyl-diphosphatase|nr:phosphatase PAP2 family protein [Planctomycetota bacterium]